MPLAPVLAPHAGDKIQLDGVAVSFRRPRAKESVEAVADVTLHVRERRFVAIVGPSGCGKTTLLRVVNGLLKPDRGTVLVSGRTPKPGPEMGFVFQSFRLIPWNTVRNNVAFPLEMAGGMSAAERRERADRYLGLVGLTRFADSYPGELSGGMKQRVALARAFVLEPEILLMDEPFAALDAQLRQVLQDELLQICQEQSYTVFFVTHNIDEAILLSDRIVLMSARPGNIRGVYDVPFGYPRGPELRSHPAFVALEEQIWADLRGEVTASIDQEAK